MPVVKDALLYYWNVKDGVTSNKIRNLAPVGVPDITNVGGTYDAANDRIALDGVDDWVDVPSESRFSLKTSFTFEYIFELQNPLDTAIQEIWGGSSYRAYADIYRTGVESYEVFFYLYQGTSVSAAPYFAFNAPELGTVQKIHLVITYDHVTDTVKAYINGRLAMTDVPGVGALSLTAGSTTIRLNGNRNEDSAPAYFYAARFYEKALTDAEVAQNTANGTAIGMEDFVEVTADATLSGEANLLSAPVEINRADATLSGAATTSATSALVHRFASDLNGTAATTATSARTRQSGATASGTAQLEAAAATIRQAMTSLTATGDLTSPAVRIQRSGSTASGTATLDSTAQHTIAATATLGGTATTTSPPVRLVQSGATLSGTATLAAEPETINGITGSAILEGNAITAATGTRTQSGGATFASESTAAASPVFGFAAASSIDGQAALSATFHRIGFGDAGLDGAADITAASAATRQDNATLSGTAELEAFVVIGSEMSARLNSICDMEITAEIVKYADATLSGESGKVFVPVRLQTAETGISGDSATSASARNVQSAATTLSADSGTSADGIRIQTAIVGLDATGTGTASPETLRQSAAALEGAAQLDAQFETLSLIEMTANLLGASGTSGTALRATQAGADFGGQAGIGSDGIAIIPAAAFLETDALTASTSVRVKRDGGLLAASAQTDAASALTAAVDLTLSGTATASALGGNLALASAALSGDTILDVNYAPGFYRKRRVDGVYDIRDTATATETRPRIHGTYSTNVRIHGVLKRKENASDA
jgi:hypothetical protein